METKEWTFVDREGWPKGEWDSEPDKVQWTDEATGMPCLAFRNRRLGHWCGYVGVAPGHPAYEKDYHDVDVSVHGGLTFSDFCQTATRDEYDSLRRRLPKLEETAKQYPNGDAAQDLKAWGHVIGDYAAWEAWTNERTICHLPAQGEPDKVWWLGFDCAHMGDYEPALHGDHMPEPLRRREPEAWETYKTLAYVRQECAQLAAQLIEPNSL